MLKRLLNVTLALPCEFIVLVNILTIYMLFICYYSKNLSGTARYLFLLSSECNLTWCLIALLMKWLCTLHLISSLAVWDIALAGSFVACYMAGWEYQLCHLAVLWVVSVIHLFLLPLAL